MATMTVNSAIPFAAFLDNTGREMQAGKTTPQFGREMQFGSAINRTAPKKSQFRKFAENAALAGAIALGSHGVAHAEEGLKITPLTPPVNATTLADGCVSAIPNFPVKQGQYLNNVKQYEYSEVPNATYLSGDLLAQQNWVNYNPYNEKSSIVNTCLTEGDAVVLVTTAAPGQLAQSYVYIQNYAQQGLTGQAWVATGAIDHSNTINAIVSATIPAQNVPDLTKALIRGDGLPLVK